MERAEKNEDKTLCYFIIAAEKGNRRFLIE